MSTVAHNNDVRFGMEHKQGLDSAADIASLDIAALARLVRQKVSQKSGPDIRDFSGQPPCLSLAQERLWFMDRLVPGSAFYNIPFAFRLEQPVREEILCRAWLDTVERHESLRIGIGSTDTGTPLVFCRPSTDFALTVHRHVSGARLAQFMRHEAETGFSLERDPLLRGFLCLMEDGSQVLLFTAHHIVFDGWSIGIFLKDLQFAHAARSLGRPPSYAPLEVSYFQYAAWHRAVVEDARKAQTTWWQEHLANLPNFEPATDFPRPAVQTFRGSVHSLHLDRDVLDAVSELARAEQATPYAVWLALFALSAARFAAQDDFAIGSSFAGRSLPATEALAGFFVENLSLRIRIDPQESLRDLVRRVRDESLTTMEHATLPFQMLAEALGRERDLSRNPVYQVAFTYQNMQSLRAKNTDLQGGETLVLTPLPVPGLTTHMDLELLAWPGDEGMDCQILYATDLFQPATIAALAEQFRELACFVAKNPSAAGTSVLCLGLDSHRSSLVSGSRRNPPLIAPWQDYVSLCTAHPDAEAVRTIVPDGNENRTASHTRAQVLARAGQIALRLRRHGVGRGSVVLICLEQGVDLLAAILAVWREGAVFTTLASEHPASFARWLCQDAHVSCVVSSKRHWQGDPALLLDVEKVSGEALSTREESELGDPAAPMACEDCACVLYTSGSTGKPKAVRLSLGAISNRLHWMWEQFPWGDGEVCCQKTSPVFVDFLWEALGPLLGGVVLVCLPDKKAADVPWFIQTLERHKVTRLVLVPSLLAQMHRISGGLEGRLTSLRLLSASGETLPSDLATATLEALPSVRLLNLYGSTEVMGDATFYEIVQRQSGSVPIGSPIHNTLAAVLDADGRIVPQGATGLLHVAGVCLALGYAGAASASGRDAWLTSDHHAHCTDAAYASLVEQTGQSVWFCTGDLARVDEQGLVHHLGRADRQIKRRGVRIEPEQIQHVLERHPQVREARVLALSGPAESGGYARPEPRLVAYVIPILAQGSHEKDEKSENSQAELEKSRAACLSQWASLYDSMYANVRSQGNILDNFLIWESSYTGKHLPVEEMREWLAESLASIHALFPKNVLEIGCGQGFLLMDLVQTCDRYTGIDISSEALACLEDLFGENAGERRDNACHADMTLLVAEATALSSLEGIGEQTFDTAIFNSVVQYFPDYAYCIEAVRQAVDRLDFGGKVFLGDLRNLAGLDLLHIAIQAHRCQKGVGAQEFLDRARARKRMESELLLAPAFWQAIQRLIPRIAAVQVSPKKGRSANELTEFRYEVVLYCDTVPHERFNGVMHTWGSGECSSYAQVRDLLAGFAASGEQALALASIPSARLALYRKIEDLAEESVLSGKGATLEEMLEKASRDENPRTRGLSPEELHELAQARNLEVCVSLDAGDGLSLNALFYHKGQKPPCLGVPWPSASVPLPDPAECANVPATSRDESSLRARLRGYLAEELPKSMLPDVLVTVPEWPRTPSGKIDWKRLPSPNARLFASASGMQLPGTADEKCVADIWKLVIGLDEVSVHDNFFEIGGTSLLLTQVHQMIQTKLKKNFPLSVLFQYPTIHALSVYLSGQEQTAAKNTGTPPSGNLPGRPQRRNRRTLRQSPR